MNVNLSEELCILSGSDGRPPGMTRRRSIESESDPQRSCRNPKEVDKMAKQRKIMRSDQDVLLVEETTSFPVPEVVISTAYVVTSSRVPEGAYFDNLPAANEEFE